MKKVLSFLLVLSLVLGTFAPAFADDNAYAEQGQILSDLEVLKGNDTGLNLDGELKREQMMIMMARLMGEADEAENFPFPSNFTDMKDAAWKWSNIVAWAQSKGITNGKEDGTFGYGDNVTVRQLETFLLRALGHEDAWNNAADLAAANDLLAGLEAMDENASVTRGYMAAMTLNTLKADKADGEKTLAADLGIQLPRNAESVETVEATVEAGVAVELPETVNVTYDNGDVEEVAVTWEEFEATEAGDFTVEGTLEGDFDFVAQAVVTVTEAELVIDEVAAIDRNQIEVKFNKAVEEGTTVELKKGLVSYTTTNTWSEDMTTVVLESSFNLPAGDYKVAVGDLTADTEVKAEEAVTVNILTKAFEAVNPAAIEIELLNQYGKEMTLSRGDFTITAFNQTTGITVAVNPATFELNASTSNKDDMIVLSVLYNAKSIVVNDTVPVINEAVNTAFDFGNVVMPEDQTMVYASDTGVEIEYVLLDQYGEETVLSLVTDVTFVSSDESVVKVASLAVDADGVLTFDAEATAGTATITALLAATGSVSTITIEVVDTEAVDQVTVATPAELVIAGEDVELPIMAVDQFGNSVAQEDITGAEQALVTFASSNGAVVAAGDFSWDEEKLLLNPTGEGSANIYVYFNGVLQNNFSVTVEEAATPVRITAVDVPALFEADALAVATVSYAELTVIDQYNREYDLTVNDEQIDIVAVDAADDVVTIDVANFNTDAGKVEFGGTATVGTEEFTVSINGVTGSEFTVKLGTVATEDVTSYELAEIGTLLAASPAHDGTITLTGKTDAGKTVQLVPGKITNVTTTDATVATATVDTVSGLTEGTVTIAAWNGGVKLAEATVTVSDESPVVTTVEFDADVETEFAAGTINISDNLVVTDQYGVVIVDAGFWTTSDASVATVAGGTVTYVAPGEVTIGYVSTNGILVTTVIEAK